MADETTNEQKPLSQKTQTELKREAKARLRRLDPAAAAAIVDDVVARKVTNSFTGFTAFIRERAVVGLAVGFVIGTQVQTVVRTFLDSFVNPLLGLLIPGKGAFTDRQWIVHLGTRTANFGWGALVYSLIDFLSVLLIIYLVIRLFQLDRLEKKS